jgi:transposase-like protein
MATPRSTRNPLFRGRWFEDQIIVLCVRWYVSYKLSYRDLVEMMADRGLSVSHTTVMRWAVRYAPEFEQKWRRYERRVGDSWRVDETYVKVSGRWVFLYRAVDRQGKTVEFYLSPRRDRAAATAFFRQALRHHGEPRVVTLDAFAPNHSALRRMGMRNEFNYRGEDPMRIRSCPYLNNLVEQDHRRIKQRLHPMLQFQRFDHARRIITGIELAAKIRKGQYDLSSITRRRVSSQAEMWQRVMAA